MNGRDSIFYKKKKIGWWRDNWRWMKFGVVGMVFVGFIGVFLGWWKQDAGLDLNVLAAPIGVQEEVPDLPFKTLEKYQGKKLVALTFDDGPNIATTPALLDLLKRKQVNATFFVLGIMIDKNPKLLLREIREGHEVGSHTMKHQVLSKMSAEAIKADSQEMSSKINGILGYDLKLLRPPYGAVNNTVKANFTVPMVTWTVDTEDWRSKNAVAVRNEVNKAVFDGAIVLMHDIYASTVEAVEGIIDDLRGQGYELVTVSEMAEVRGVKMAAGEVYGCFKP